MKKILNTIAILMLFSITFSACKKGAQGEPGPTGNANVALFTFENKTFTSSLNLIIPITTAKVDSSLVLAYYNPTLEDVTAWYPIPGIGSSGSYQTRYFLFRNAGQNTYTFGIRVLDLAGNPYVGALTFRKIKVIFAPAASITPLSSSIDDLRNDYKLAEKHFNLTL